MNVTLREVLAGAEQHAVPLTAECVGYLVLGAADQVLGAPRSVGTEDLLLSEDGAVRVAGGRAARADEAERDLRAVLDALLLPASSASAGLLRASRRPPGTGIEGLVRELETALIPVNRSAAKRALSRLQRETRRALDSGRIRVEASVPPPAPAAPAEPSVAPPAADNVVVPPLPAVAAPPVVLAPPSATTETAASEPLPSVALPPVATELAPMVNPVAAVSVVAAVSPIAVAHDELAGSVLQAERRDHTLMLSEVAPREPVVLAPQLVETRPEPVVRRASQRPAPPPAPIRVAAEPGELGHTVPLPPVAPVASPEPAAPVEAFPEQETRDTPVLGTRLSAQVWADDSTNSAELEQSELDISVIVEARPEFASAPVLETAVLEAEVLEAEVLEAEVLENDDGLIEVIFEDEARAASPEDRELLVAEAAPHEANETTDPCPPLAAESVLMPEVEAAAVEPETPAPATLDADTLRPAAPAEAAEPAVALDEPALEPPPVDLLPSDVELAALVESALPPWTTAEAPAFEVTPPPRVALPTPRRSDVEALLGRLNDAPVGVDELRSGLKHLAGLDLTPPPPGTERGE